VTGRRMAEDANRDSSIRQVVADVIIVGGGGAGFWTG